MIKWIDIQSPSLRKLHQTWLGFRGTRLMAHVNEYNRFIGHAPSDLSLCVIFPMDGGSPVVKFIGDGVRQAFPELASGRRFDDIRSTVNRTQIATPFHKIATGRQPDARRGSWRVPGETQSYEQVLLPFDNDQLRVCVIHAVFEVGRSRG